MKRVRQCLVVALTLTCVAARSSAGTLYMNSGGHAQAVDVSGPTVVHDAVIAGQLLSVTNTIWSGSQNGSFQYTLGLVATQQSASPVNVSRFTDSTSDGQYSYGIDSNTGIVYRHNLNWTDPAPLFQANGGPLVHSGPDVFPDPFVGITYDVYSDSFWLGGKYTAEIWNYSRLGAPLNHFSTASEYNAGLAFDPTDGTLWVINSDMGLGATNVFQHYTHQGKLLGSITVPGPGALGGYWDAEFSIPNVPEPSTYVTWTLGFALLLRVLGNRRKRPIVRLLSD